MNQSALTRIPDGHSLAQRRIVRAVTHLSNPLVICNEVLSALDDIPDYRRGCIVMKRRLAGPLVLVAHSMDGRRSTQEQFREMARVQEVVNLGQPGVIARVVATGRSLIVNDVSAEPAYQEGAMDVLSEACVPLIDRAVCIGALNVESTVRGRFLDADRLFLETVAALITPAIMRLPVEQIQ